MCCRIVKLWKKTALKIEKKIKQKLMLKTCHKQSKLVLDTRRNILLSHLILKQIVQQIPTRQIPRRILLAFPVQLLLSPRPAQQSIPPCLHPRMGMQTMHMQHHMRLSPVLDPLWLQKLLTVQWLVLVQLLWHLYNLLHRLLQNHVLISRKVFNNRKVTKMVLLGMVVNLRSIRKMMILLDMAC